VTPARARSFGLCPLPETGVPLNSPLVRGRNVVCHTPVVRSSGCLIAKC